MVLNSPDPYHHRSTHDLEFKALSPQDQADVIRLFDGYGLADLVEERARQKTGASGVVIPDKNPQTL
jgi:hypothetical protein